MAVHDQWWGSLDSFLEQFDQTQGPAPKPQIPGAPKAEPKYTTAPKLNVPPNPAPPPITTADKMAVINEAGRLTVLCSMLYGGNWRYVEPYSWKRFTTGLRVYMYCHRHQHIELFDPNKIESIEITKIPYKPRWVVSCGLQ